MLKETSLMPIHESGPRLNRTNRLNEDGQGLTEYLILLFLISIICIATAKTLGETVKTKLQTARRHIHQDITLND
jgi:Flp pilus assembly pilin Flp